MLTGHICEECLQEITDQNRCPDHPYAELLNMDDQEDRDWAKTLKNSRRRRWLSPLMVVLFFAAFLSISVINAGLTESIWAMLVANAFFGLILLGTGLPILSALGTLIERIKNQKLQQVNPVDSSILETDAEELSTEAHEAELARRERRLSRKQNRDQRNKSARVNVAG